MQVFSKSKKALKNFIILLIMHRHLCCSPSNWNNLLFCSILASYSVLFTNHKLIVFFSLCFFPKLSECFLLPLVASETYATLSELPSKNENILIPVNYLNTFVKASSNKMAISEKFPVLKIQNISAYWICSIRKIGISSLCFYSMLFIRA